MSMDARVNFAFGTVTTAPSPATSGLSMVVSNSSAWPTAPFNATVHAAGATRDQIRTGGEIVRCSVNASGTWTIARAAEGPNAARAIVVGDEVSFGVTAKTLDDIISGGPFTGMTITPTGSTLNRGFTVVQTALGTYVPGPYGYELNSIKVNSDNVDVADQTLYSLFVLNKFGGTSTTGGRTAVMGYVQQTAVTKAANPPGSHIGGVFIAETLTGDGGTNLGAGARGSYFGMNPQIRATNAPNCYILAHEFDMQTAGTTTARYVANVASCSFHVAQGSLMDAAYAIWTGGLTSGFGPGVGFKNGLLFAEPGSGIAPVSSAGTLIGSYRETMGAAFPVAYGCDFRDFTFSSAAFASPGFTLGGNGSIELKTTNAFQPAVTVWNDNNGTSNGYLLLKKSRAGGPVQVGDELGTLAFYGHDSASASQNSCYLHAVAYSVGAGFVSSYLQVVNARLVLAASIAGAASLTVPAGTAPTAPNAGDVWSDGKVFYGSGAATQTGVLTANQIATVANGAKTALTNNIATAQNIFAAAVDTLTVLASTTYRFKARICLNTGGTTHTTAFGLGGTATFTAIHYTAMSTSGAALAAPQMIRVSAATATVLTATSTAVTTDIYIEGVMRVSGAGTIIPQVTFSAGPTGTCEVEVDSFFELYPLGSDALVAVGPFA